MQFSIIKKSDIDKARRFDAEYFKPYYIELYKILSLNFFKPNKELTTIKSGTTPKNRNDTLKEGIVLLKTDNIRNNILSPDEEYFYITPEVNNKMRSSQVFPRDVLINIVGATTDVIGRVAYIPYSFPTANITQAMAYCRIKDETILKPEFLFIYLQTFYGKGQIKRLARPTGQYNLNLNEVGQILIPVLHNNFQQQIENLVKQAYEHQKQSKQLYREAEQLLLEELGLLDYRPKHRLTFTTTKKQVNEARRFDAEYFQPKYEEVIRKIKEYPGGSKKIKELFSQVKSSFSKDLEYWYYIEISDINIATGEIILNLYQKKELPANAKIKVKKGDVIISKVRPNRGAITIIDTEKENLIVSGAFTVLREKNNFKKEVLLTFLKSPVIKNILLRFNTGTSYPVIKDEDILNFEIPLIRPELQEEIAQKIRQSFALRRQSKSLLEVAKKRVEEEIEKAASANE